MNTFTTMKALASRLVDVIVEVDTISVSSESKEKRTVTKESRQSVALCIDGGKHDNANTTKRTPTMLRKGLRGQFRQNGKALDASTMMATQPTRAGEVGCLNDRDKQVEKKPGMAGLGEVTQEKKPKKMPKRRQIAQRAKSRVFWLWPKGSFSGSRYVVLEEYPGEDDISEHPDDEAMHDLSSQQTDCESKEELEGMAESVPSDQHVVVSSSYFGINENGDLEGPKEPDDDSEASLLSHKQSARLQRWKKKAERFLKTPMSFRRLFSKKKSV